MEAAWVGEEGVNEGLQSHRGITKDKQPHRGGEGGGWVVKGWGLHGFGGEEKLIKACNHTEGSIRTSSHIRGWGGGGS